MYPTLMSVEGRNRRRKTAELLISGLVQPDYVHCFPVGEIPTENPPHLLQIRSGKTLLRRTLRSLQWTSMMKTLNNSTMMTVGPRFVSLLLFAGLPLAFVL